MNRKQVIVLLVFVILLGAAGFYLRKQQATFLTSASPTLGKKLLGDLPVNDIAHISARQGTNQLNLVKKDELWRVAERNGYPANFSEISEFLLKVRELKIIQTEKVGPSHLSLLALVTGQGSNAALVVEFKDKNEKSLKTLLLGKKHMRKSERPSQFGEMGGDEGFPDGRYVKVGADSDNVILISDPLSNIDPKPDAWVNKDFFKVEKLRS